MQPRIDRYREADYVIVNSRSNGADRPSDIHSKEELDEEELSFIGEPSVWSIIF